MITGKVSKGCGGASKIPEEVFQARRLASEANLVRGTLNVKVEDLEGDIERLGLPHFETDTDNAKLGPLRWWGIEVVHANIKDLEAKTFLVRHYKTGTKYFEIMSEVSFKEDFGIDDGDDIQFTPTART